MILALVLACPSLSRAQVWDQSTAKPMVSDGDMEEETSTTGFAKPYEYERQAYGYDPEGVEYKENQAEDFQVIFITSMPFSALASFGLTGLVSMAANGKFQVGGDYFLPFLGGILIGSTTVACVSVLTNKYPPPSSTTYVESAPLHPLAFQLPLLTARF